MLLHMRTTLRLDDDLLSAAKQHAAAHGLTLTRLIEDALRAMLSARADAATAPFSMPTFGDGGVLPGVDFDDSAGLLDLMEGP